MTADQFAVIAGLLTDIRNMLLWQQSESEDCEHPEDKRIDLSTLSDLDHWVCGVCRFDNKAPDQPMN